jgi:elongation factor P--(R)-beta-lysine ligase
MQQPSPWWNPQRHADRRPLLIARGRIKASIRGWFLDQGFTEVEPGIVQYSPGNETHLHAFKTEAVGTDLGRRDLYLHTSPEFAMKKLLAAGEHRIFAFVPVFRNRERGALHSPEFTMLEWYRANEPYQTLWEDCRAILGLAAEQSGNSQWAFRGRTCDVAQQPRKTTLQEAFARFARIPLSETMNATAVDRDALAHLAHAEGIGIAGDDTWSDIFSKVLAAKIEPALGVGAPEILYEYPITEAALARPSPDDPSVAERFELYVSGVELANGFGELGDPAEQRRRFEIWMAEKDRIYGERYPIDEEFIAALPHMPPACGCALGFDRLVMLATGAQRIDEILWTPFPDMKD